MNEFESEWFANEAFWRETYPFMFPEKRVAAATGEVEQIIALSECAGGRVLDLACGPGRHSIAFARRGFAVTGVDRSPFLLEHARVRARENDADIEWVQSDMRAFRRSSSFDLAVCLFTSFGFFRDDADNRRVLENVATSLRPGGVFVLDLLGKEILAKVFTPTSSHEMADALMVSRRRAVEDWSRMENEWLVIRDGASRTFPFSHWIYSAREIKEMFLSAGFADVCAYGDYSGAPYGPEATRLVILGRTDPR
ncbi:MAG TPA: class I SAM-dependent methyltransferase [Gemmatimonadaceae bacterium]|jgi:SAM-dependent methyltransferase